MSGETSPETVGTPESEAREEAEWELITAHTLRGRGDFEGAATWFRRAVEHLMDAGDDDRALEVARLAADMRTQPPPAPSVAPSAPAPAAPAPVAPAPIAEAHVEPVAPAPVAHIAAPVAPVAHPPQEHAPVAHAPAPHAHFAPRHAPVAHAPVAHAPVAHAPVVHAPVAPVVVDEPSIVVAPDSTPPPAPAPSSPPQPFLMAPSIAPLEPLSIPLPVVEPSPSEPAPAPSEPAPAPPMSSQAPIASSVPTAPLMPATPSRRPLSYAPERASQSDQMAAQLPALPVFTEMPIESLRALARQVTVIHFAPGDVLVEGGSSDGPMLVLTEGTARVSAAHQRTALDTATVGDMVGEIAAYHGGVQVTTVVAESAGAAVAFPPSLVRALAREYLAFRTTLEEVISDRAFAALPGNAGLLRAMAPAARESVYALFEPVRMREGDALFSEGIAPSAVWLVAAGEVELYGGDLGARGLTKAQAGTALCVGPVLANEPCGVSARALRDVLVARIGAASFRGLAAQYPEIGRCLADIGIVGRGIAC